MAEFGNSYFYLFGWSSEICERFLLRFNLNVNVNNLHPQNAEVYRDIIKPTNSFSRLVLAVLILLTLNLQSMKEFPAFRKTLCRH